MRRDEDELEKYLSEFRPREVKPLELPRTEFGMRSRWIVIAAALLVCAAGGLWYGARMKPKNNVTPTLEGETPIHTNVEMKNAFTLTKLALNDEQGFQAELVAESRSVLPNFQDTNSTLHALAKE